MQVAIKSIGKRGILEWGRVRILFCSVDSRLFRNTDMPSTILYILLLRWKYMTVCSQHRPIGSKFKALWFRKWVWFTCGCVRKWAWPNKRFGVDGLPLVTVCLLRKYTHGSVSVHCMQLAIYSCFTDVEKL